MRVSVRKLLLVATHVVAVGGGFALGIYMLPILIAPESPNIEVVRSTADVAQFKGMFRRDLADSDALHWGEGTVFIGPDNIAFEGRLAPGPDYRLYLSPKFIETEADFEALKPDMVQVGLVQTFENFMVAVPESVTPAEFNAAIVWCESFGQFITAAAYQ
ncbi:MAG: DM13 domain-containing protein [Gammaproteobacteria bacterium]|nr:DM13 domain-containing protein [Gammaproteobacteria bacterium]NNL51320.1 DM13 domain-containing protein [Woeseiaceae bacterium]